MTRVAARKSRQPVPPVSPPATSPPSDWNFLLRCLGMVGALLMLTLLATLLFRTRLTTVGGSEMTWDRAVFFAINAATLSGFRLPINPGDLKPFGQLIDYLLVVSATLIYLLIGGWSLRRICKYPFADFAIAQHTVTFFILLTLIVGSILLGNGISLFQALFDASAAVGNCGLFLGRFPEITSLKLHTVLLPIAVLGGLSVPVIIDAWQTFTHRRRWNPHTAVALASAAAAYLLSVVTLIIAEGATSPGAIASVGALALNARTPGFPQDLSLLSPATFWLLLPIMAVGASTGGSGGGIKSNSLWLIARDSRKLLRRQPVSPILGIALLAVGGYVVLVAITIIGLSYCQPTVAGEQLLFAAFSAVSNCGLSRQPIDFTGGALFVLSLSMLAGRVWSLALLVTAAALRYEGDVAAA